MRAAACLIIIFLSVIPVVSAQDKPTIEIPEVVVVGQDVRTVQQEKQPIAPQTGPIGLQSDVQAGKVQTLAPPDIGRSVAGPVAENPGCLLFSGVGGKKDESLFKRGLKQYVKGEDRNARSLFAQLAQEYPDSVYRGASTFWWGESHFRKGEEADALVHYEQVVASYPREPLRDYALYRAAELQLRRGSYDRAAQYTTDLQAQYPASPTVEYATYLAGEVAFRQGRYREATDAFVAFMSRYSQSSLVERAALMQGEGLYQLGQYAEARAAYRGFIDQYGGSPLAREARYGLAWTRLKEGELEQAQRAFQRLYDQSPEPRYAEARQYVAFVAALRKGDQRSARRQLQQLRQDYPEGTLMPAAWSELAWSRFDGQAYADALQLYRQLKQNPQTPRAIQDVAQFMTGECLYQLGRYGEATTAFRAVHSEADAGLREKVAFRLGLSLYHQRQYKQAAQVLQALIVRYAGSPYRDEGLYWLAEAHFRREAYGASLQASKRLPGKSRLYPYGLHSRGWVYLRQQQWQKAIISFQQLVDSYPKSAVRPDALYRLAESYQQLGQDDTAQPLYEQYLQEYPSGPQAGAAQLQLALLDGQADDLEQNLAALQTIQEQYPGTEAAIDAEFRQGRLLFRHNRFGEAREVFTAFSVAHAKHQKAPRAGLRLADTYYNEKAYREGLIAYRKVTLLYPAAAEVVDARYGVILSHYQLDEYPQFLSESQGFVRDFPDHPLSESVLLQMAEHFQAQQEFKAAIETYTYMATTYTDQPLAGKAHLRLGELYLKTDALGDAMAAFEQVRDGEYDEALKSEAAFGLAQAAEAKGDADAVKRYAQVSALYPDSPLAARGLYQAGRLAQAKKDYSQARTYFERVVLKYPHDSVRSDSWLQWGVVLLEMNQAKRALEVLQEAQQTQDQHIAAQAQWQIGRAHTAAGALQEGTNAYLRVAYLYPNEQSLVAEALRQAARNYVSLGKCPEALTVYEKLRKQTTAVHLQQVILQEIAGSGCQS